MTSTSKTHVLPTQYLVCTVPVAWALLEGSRDIWDHPRKFHSGRCRAYKTSDKHSAATYSNTFRLPGRIRSKQRHRSPGVFANTHSPSRATAINKAMFGYPGGLSFFDPFIVDSPEPFGHPQPSRASRRAANRYGAPYPADYIYQPNGSASCGVAAPMDPDEDIMLDPYATAYRQQRQQR